jgi:hypothetical protein
MIDRIEAAIRHWEGIRPTSATDLRMGVADQLADWVARMACPVIAELTVRPDFRHLARWSIENLAIGSRSPARQIVDEIDRRLIVIAKGIATSTRVALRAAPPASNRESLEASAKSLDYLRSRPWRDLCSEFDYFGPVADLNLEKRHQGRTREGDLLRLADFMPYCRPKWRSMGDFIYRCLVVRIGIWKESLQKHASVVGESTNGKLRIIRLPQRSRRLSAGVEKELTPWEELVELEENLGRLRMLCEFDPQAPLRQAAMTLVQTYAAFRPNAALPWLGSVEGMKGMAAEIRWRLERRDDISVAETCAAALAEVRGLYREASIDIIVRQMSEERRLCLLDGPGRREAYWEGEPLDIEWTRYDREWTLLVALATKAKSGQGVDSRDELRISVKDSRRALVGRLPAELRRSIRSEGFIFQLHLPPEEIYLGKLTTEAAIEEITGAVRLRSSGGR